jgi:hypothetical protein
MSNLEQYLKSFHSVIVREENYNEMLDWSLKNCQGKFCEFFLEPQKRKWYFQNKNDAVFFSLKWVNQNKDNK